MTLGLTLICLNTSPIYPFVQKPFYDKSWILFIWIAETLIYVLLAKIEDLSLQAKYGEEFLNYAIKVPFMFPFFNLNKEKNRKNK